MTKTETLEAAYRRLNLDLIVARDEIDKLGRAMHDGVRIAHEQRQEIERLRDAIERAAVDTGMGHLYSSTYHEAQRWLRSIGNRLRLALAAQSEQDGETEGDPIDDSQD